MSGGGKGGGWGGGGGERGTYETEFERFSNTKVNVTNRDQKLDEEIGFIYVLFPCFLLDL